MHSRSSSPEECTPQYTGIPSSDSAEDHARNVLADATLTSRISIQKFCCVVSQFSNFKHGLVTETGFSGLMHLKIPHKLNLKFSSSLMVRVDPEQCSLALDQSRKMPITDQEINDVFGLPQGSRIIAPGHTDLSKVCIEFSRLASNISTKGVHSQKAAEFVVSKPLDENSSIVDCECFKIAFVIFSDGHVLNPCAKHDYTSVDYYAALVVPAEINSFNWCRFVKDSLMKGIRKIKSDIANGNNTIHIVGCHLLLQVLQGEIIWNQIIGKEPMSHKCFALIVRRIAQIERTNSSYQDGSIWRKLMEPDFTTLVLRNIDPSLAISIQAEFMMEKHIDQCRMFCFPACLHYGWCYYLLDMLRKRIVVLDPQAGPFGYSTDRVKFHEQISHAIHGAFFKCVKAFYSSWPCTSNGWTRAFLTIMTEKLPSEHSGICSIYMASHYDGDNLQSSTTKENLGLSRRAALHEVLKLEDNRWKEPQTAMQHIRSSINSL